MKYRIPQPKIEPIGRTEHGRPLFRLLQNYRLEVPMGRGVYVFRIPCGFETDFASIPRPLWPLLNPMDPHILVPALIHDDLYKSGGGLLLVAGEPGKMQEVNGLHVSRFMSDAWFRFIMQLSGAPLWKRIAAYYAVRTFGWAAFARERR